MDGQTIHQNAPTPNIHHLSLLRDYNSSMHITTCLALENPIQQYAEPIPTAWYC